MPRVFNAWRGMMAHPISAVIVIGFLILVALSAGFSSTLSLVAPEQKKVLIYATALGTVLGAVELGPGVQDATGQSFITSWARDKGSETITAHGSLETRGSVPTAMEYHYVWSIDTGDGWKPLKTSKTQTISLPGGVFKSGTANQVPLTADTVQVTGPKTGIIRVELMVKTPAALKLAGVDGATLLDGSGSVKQRAGDSDIFEEGSTATFLVSSGAGAWRLTVYDGDGKKVCVESKFKTASLFSGFKKVNAALDNLCRTSWEGPRSGATFQVKIPAGAFRADGKNRWTVTLENTVIQQSAEAIIVIDQKIKQPEPVKTTVTVTGGGVTTTAADNTPVKVKQGQAITYEMSSRSNPITGARVSHFMVYVWYGAANLLPPTGSPYWVAEGVNVGAALRGSDGAYVGTYSFTVTEVADLQWRFHAVDEAGRESGSTLNGKDSKELAKAGDDCTPTTCAEAGGWGGTPPNDNGRGTADNTDAPDGGDEVGLNDKSEDKAETSASNAFIVLALGVLLMTIVWMWAPFPPAIKAGISGLGLIALVWYTGLVG